jgi:hypothetical protein
MIAKRFHRRFNVGLAAAAIAVAVLTVLAVVLAQGQSNDNDELVDGSYQDAADGAAVRTLANDAKANESLLLVKRGSGQAYQDLWVEAAGKVEDLATGDTLSAWNRYAALHGEIVELDASGDWSGAVEAATTRDEDGASAALDAVDRSAQADVDQAAEVTTDTLRSGRTYALVLAIATLLLGLVAAALCAWGINQRRKEYS